jgi:hypothetical protein
MELHLATNAPNPAPKNPFQLFTLPNNLLQSTTTTITPAINADTVSLDKSKVKTLAANPA